MKKALTEASEFKDGKGIGVKNFMIYYSGHGHESNGGWVMNEAVLTLDFDKTIVSI